MVDNLKGMPRHRIFLICISDVVTGVALGLRFGALVRLVLLTLATIRCGSIGNSWVGLTGILAVTSYGCSVISFQLRKGNLIPATLAGVLSFSDICGLKKL